MTKRILYISKTCENTYARLKIFIIIFNDYFK